MVVFYNDNKDYSILFQGLAEGALDLAMPNEIQISVDQSLYSGLQLIGNSVGFGLE